MRKFLGFLTIAILITGGTAHACPPLSPTTSAPVFAPLPPWSPMYYCAASQAPQSIGDLTYAGWAKHVQVCSRTCSYAPISPSDPSSPLIEVECGPGYHPASYFVDPPQPPSGKAAISLKSATCNDLAPPKAAATPVPHWRNLSG